MITELLLILSLALLAGGASFFYAKNKYGKFRTEILEGNEQISQNLSSMLRELTLQINTTEKHIKQYVRSSNLMTSINLYRQIEAKDEIDRILPNSKLQGLRGWAFSPDALLVIIKTILQTKPKVIVELGSGTSTIAITDLAKEYNLDTKLISVDHLDTYLAQTKDKVVNTSFVEYTHAPIEEQTVSGIKKQVKWYDTKTILRQLNGRKIDMLIIDGPPEVTQKEARMPAYNALFKSLSDNAIIILDDYNRPDEQKAVQEWMAFDKKSVINVENVETEKGLAIIRRSPK